MIPVGPDIQEARQVHIGYLLDGLPAAGGKSHAELLILCARIGFNP